MRLILVVLLALLVGCSTVEVTLADGTIRRYEHARVTALVGGSMYIKSRNENPIVYSFDDWRWVEWK